MTAPQRVPTGTRIRRGPRYRLPCIPETRRSRTARALDCSEATAEKRLWGVHAVNRDCATIVTADLKAGDLAAVAAFLAVIDAALAGTPLPLLQALHEAEMADTAEQLADESFRHKVQQGTATVEDAKEFIKKSACARFKAEQAEQAAALWVAEREAAR